MRYFAHLAALSAVACIVIGGCPSASTGDPLSADNSGGNTTGGSGDASSGTGAGTGNAGSGSSGSTGDSAGADGGTDSGPAGDGGGTSSSGPVGGSTNAGDTGSTGSTTDLAALQVFPSDNPWNQDVSALSVHPNSDQYIASIGLDRGLHPDFGTVWEGAPIGIPYNVVNADTPRYSVAFDYADESDAGPYPIPDGALIEGGPDADGDRHILLVDVAGKKLYELFYAYRGDSGWTAGSGAIFDLTSNSLRPAGWTSADAAGLPIFPGLVRYDEAVERGEIRHAIRFTVSRTQRAYIPPATHFASSDTNADLPPMGLRVRLKADFDVSSFSPTIRVILTAMKRYGMFVADNGSSWYISGAPDSRWSDDELHDLNRVAGRDFEAVYTGEAVAD